jgi:hypothetical protein
MLLAFAAGSMRAEWGGSQNAFSGGGGKINKPVFRK